MSLSFDPDVLRDLLPPLEQAVELPAMQAYRTDVADLLSQP